MRLSAALIVRDEAARIEQCIAALLPLVDEVVVHDTGSVDDTVERARAAGADVSTGSWHDDFARARTVPLQRCRGDWVLSVDADELMTGDARLLRAALADADHAQTDVFGVHTRVPAADLLGGEFTNRQPRLFRRRGARWVGRVHERIVHGTASTPADPVPLPADALTIVHWGYHSAETVREKAHRNLAIGLAEIAELQQGEDAEALGRALFDVGRSLVGLGSVEQSLAPFVDVRSLVATGSPLWCQATDFLARQLLVVQREREALALAEELHVIAEHAEYADWLAAQALVQLGEYAAANARIGRVRRVIDAAGRAYDPERLREQRRLIVELVRATAVGSPDSATLAGC